VSHKRPEAVRAESSGSSRLKGQGGQPYGPVVVGIGASAGGLDPIERLLAHVPGKSGLVFVVVQHLERRHPSMLPELLSRHTRMRVLQAHDGMKLEPDHVYVIAPNTALTVVGSSLRVLPAPEAGPRAAIDEFLCSLAKELGEHAVGIVLSGSGNDGTAGLRAVREHGGLTLAQSPETAQHESMPTSAIEAGQVDVVLPVERMPTKVLEYAGSLANYERFGAEALDEDLTAHLGEICDLLRQRTGHDFSRYKKATLLRRIRRRVQVQHARSGDDYLKALAGDPREPERLLKDLLIGVTHFFRDREAFEVLDKWVISRLVERPADLPIRIWVPGCASGEEAYSIAILLRERLERAGLERSVHIFATDIDTGSLEEARQGRYAPDIAEHVSPERLAHFFTRQGQDYVVAKELREMCIFSQHSLVRDPPFSNLDLVSCRNVLIYFEAELQKSLVPLFHYALRPGGYLFLGPSEGLAAHQELFESLDGGQRVFRRQEVVARPAVAFPLVGRTGSSHRARQPFAPSSPGEPARSNGREQASFALERMALEEYTAPCAVVNGRGEILFVAGRIGRFFQPPFGALTTNLLDVAPAALRLELPHALQVAATTRKKVVRDRLPVELEDGVHSVRLTVRPLPGVDPDAGLIAVIVQEQATLEETGAHEAPLSLDDHPAMAGLEEELRATRAELRATAERQEATNEELKSSNEELISTNEELQSANEELQTSKEELQSLNEELETINAELRQKVEELAAANSDILNLFASTEIATLFLDRDLRIKRFTPAATHLFRLVESDVGRPIGDFAPRFEGQDLVGMAREVLRSAEPVERQGQAAEGRSWCILRVFPYRTVADLIEGVVVTFVDVTELKRAEGALRESEASLKRSQQIAHLGSWELDLVANRLTWSDEVYRIFGLRPQQFAATYEAFLEHVHPDDRAAVDAAYSGSVRDGRDHYEIEHRVVRKETGEVRHVHEKCEHVRDAQGRIVRSLGMVHDITELTRSSEELARSREGLRRLAVASTTVMAKTDIGEMLQAISEAALVLTGARLASCGHGHVSGQQLVRGCARAPGAVCSPEELLRLENGGVHLALVEGAEAIRLTDAELRARARWVGLPEGQVPMRGLLGVRMTARNGKTNGMILATDKEQGDFTAEDEALLRQLATVASLALQHVEARISLEESDRRKNQFLAMLSHELRNPLAPIRNSLHVLERAAAGGEQARRAQSVINRQVGHMARLVDDLLDVTRISRGKIQLQRERLDLCELVRRAVEDHREDFAKNHLELELSAPEDALWVLADRTRIAQVIGNLLGNSAKFTPAGGKATVSLEGNAGHAVLRVRDNGIGIASDMLPMVFEPFAQADTTLDRSRGGLGLGLAMVKGLVEMHGGTVTVESDGHGEGAEFTVQLPLERAQASAEPRVDRRVHDAGPRRVLVIEDNVDAAESLRELLELSEHIVEVAFSGAEGLEKAKVFRPDIVLCDIGLPTMDGYQVAGAMRADPDLRQARLVALTGYASADDVARSLDAGFDAHIAKPPDPERLGGLHRWASAVVGGKFTRTQGNGSPWKRPP